MVRAFRPLIRRTAALALLLVFASTAPAGAMTGARNGALPDPLPLFPADNWWNLDIGNWPVDPNSSKYISFINNGGTRRLHPHLGGNHGDPQGPNPIYGIPYPPRSRPPRRGRPSGSKAAIRAMSIFGTARTGIC